MSAQAAWWVGLLVVGLGALFSAPVSAADSPKPVAKKNAAEPAKPALKPMPTWKAGTLSPIKDKAPYIHGPYEQGDCSVCHKHKDPKNPGPVLDATNELCLGCHEEYRDYVQRAVKHRPAVENCSYCHNAHNSRNEHLLHDEAGALCLRCHDGVKQLLATAKVKHSPMEEGSKCMNCHAPHGSNVEALLLKTPFDLCMDCHSKDNVLDSKGKALTNMKKLLDDNPEWHAPVAAKDCSVCHNPHAGNHFRMLASEYPAKFYEPYSAQKYALCFECHNEQMAATPETTTLTEFRQGSRNLHFLHVNKAELGRTCRACHEVHASKAPFHIRDGVPFGNRGWILKIQYDKTELGGTCAKSCHAKRSYSRQGK